MGDKNQKSEPKNGLISAIQKQKEIKELKNGKTEKTKSNKSKSKNRSSSASLSKKSKKKRKKSLKSGNNSDDIPSDLSHIEKLQLIYPKLGSSKLPHSKRLKLIKICSSILSDKECDANTAKFAVDGFKKVFTEQLKDKKLGMQKELYSILKTMIMSHVKLYKVKNTYFLKLCINHIAK